MSLSSSSISGAGGGRAALSVRINRCYPLPDHWVKVKELNVEKRDPCEVNSHQPSVELMRRQLFVC